MKTNPACCLLLALAPAHCGGSGSDTAADSAATDAEHESSGWSGDAAPADGPSSSDGRAGMDATTSDVSLRDAASEATPADDALADSPDGADTEVPIDASGDGPSSYGVCSPGCGAHAACAAGTCVGCEAGVLCGCIAELKVASDYDATDIGMVARRVDGTVWVAVGTSGGWTAVKVGGSPLLTTAVTSGIPITAMNIGCAVSQGNVWCFPMSGTLSHSTYLGGGLGASTATSSPVEVVTGADGGSPLANVTQISEYAGDPVNSSGPSICAVTSSGGVWCWGNNGRAQLGTGDTSDVSYARPVLAAASTPFTGAVEVTVGYGGTCARKSDATVWCWGDNTYGELGTVPTTPSNSTYPVQVTFPGSGSQQNATRLLSGPNMTHCAIMQDTSVVCWGFDAHGQTGAYPPSSPPYASVPTRVNASSGGPALTGVVDVADNGEATCAVTASTDVTCWGSYTNTGLPYAYQSTTQNSVTGVRLPLAGGYYAFAYVDESGIITVNGNQTQLQSLCSLAP